MSRSANRLSVVCAVVLVVSSAGAVLFGWPTRFDGSGNPNVTAGELVARGTATSLPPPP